MNYKALSLVYDRLLGSRFGEAEKIRGIIRRHHPRAINLVEFACGSGGVLAHLADFYDVAGLDISPEMLALARRRLPRTPLIEGSMTSARFGRKFDVVLCIFDSINHLTRFGDWRLVFKNGARHLNPGGILIVEINTISRLRKLVGTSSIVSSGPDYVAFRVTGTGADGVTWNVDLFKHERGEQYRLLKERIREQAFPVGMIRKALARDFENIQMLNESGKRTTKEEGRRYLVCRLKAKTRAR